MPAPQLGEADKRAVDMLLDQLPQTAADSVAGFTTSAGSVVQPERLAGVRRTLSLLDHLVAPDPPSDLLTRTLARIERSPVTHRSTPGPGAPGESLRLDLTGPSEG